jgi:hypothetical protein
MSHGDHNASWSRRFAVFVTFVVACACFVVTRKTTSLARCGRSDRW